MKIFLLICSILCGSVVGGGADVSVINGGLNTHTIFNGLVKTVSWADQLKGTRSEIVVIDTSKKFIHILVTSTTTFWDADAKDITADKVAPRQHINVIYTTTPEGINIGKSIKILK